MSVVTPEPMRRFCGNDRARSLNLEVSNTEYLGKRFRFVLVGRLYIYLGQCTVLATTVGCWPLGALSCSLASRKTLMKPTLVRLVKLGSCRAPCPDHCVGAGTSGRMCMLLIK